MDTVKPTPEPASKPSGLRKFMRWFIGLTITGIIVYIGIAYLLGAVMVYSQGDRIGYIYKFSRKGYIFKTDEGILKTGFVNLGGTPTPNEEWVFSVADDSVAKQITNIDQRVPVKLYYKEHYVKLFFRGDTKYFVYKVEEMKQ